MADGASSTELHVELGRLVPEYTYLPQPESPDAVRTPAVEKPEDSTRITAR
jgi:hypothetical protein